MSMNLYKNDLPSSVVFKDSVAIDTETMGLITKRDRLCLVQMCSKDGEVHMVQIEKGQQHKAVNLRKMLEDSKILKIFHFARFDIEILNHTFGIRVNNIYCTKIASKLVRTYTDRHGLKNLVKEILGIEISKLEQSSDWGREELSDEQLKYAAGDVLYLHALKERLDYMLARENRTELAHRCFEALQLVSDLDLLGVCPEELFVH
ncbi:MAG: ribonuclease H-like domain-containing protein [Alphaproteobacteria bacterium]|nr:ribonuclease H-like domain-containing protein [Alphaproteobacteria bacterium]